LSYAGAFDVGDYVGPFKESKETGNDKKFCLENTRASDLSATNESKLRVSSEDYLEDQISPIVYFLKGPGFSAYKGSNLLETPNSETFAAFSSIFCCLYMIICTFHF
jgi:hypothetical protein